MFTVCTSVDADYTMMHPQPAAGVGDMLGEDDDHFDGANMNVPEDTMMVSNMHMGHKIIISIIGTGAYF